MGIREDLQSDYAGRPIVIWIGIGLLNAVVYLLNPKNIFTRRWRSWQLAITNRGSWAKDVKHPSSYWAFDVLDQCHLARSSFVQPSIVLVFRLFVVGYFLFCMVWQAAGPLDVSTRYKMSRPGDWMLYFTNWTFVGLALYAVLGVAVCWKDQRPSKTGGDINEGYTPLHCAFILVYVAVYAAAIMLTAFYWMVIYDGRPVNVDNPIRHGGNVALLTFELFLTRIPIAFYHFQVVILYGTAYLLFMWIYYFITADWTYASLDWRKPGAAIYYPVLPILLLIAFVIMYCLAMLREKILSRCANQWCYDAPSASAWQHERKDCVEPTPAACTQSSPPDHTTEEGLSRLKSY